MDITILNFQFLANSSHVLLACIKPLLLKHRRQQQSGFTPDRSTTDRILTLNLVS